MQLGICADVKDIKHIAEMDFDYIELYLTQIAALSDEEFDTVRLMLTDVSLRCASCCIMFPREFNIHTQAFAELLEYAAAAFARAALLGAKYIVFGSGAVRSYGEGTGTAEAYQRLRDFVTLLGDEAAKHNIIITVEPLNKGESNMINSITDGLAFVESVNHPHVALLADFYHMRMENEAVSALLSAGKHLRHAHIANGNGRGFPLHAQEDDYAAFISTLRQIGYNGGISIEGYTNNLTQDAPNSLAFLRESMFP
ncbi:MAG: sugar phosphate isomerase/epimerase [Defluviitaleaceae bacterium]|nr:sugar phosphate isomerase/epimerase [Defluviitaleaceae bacterium]